MRQNAPWTPEGLDPDIRDAAREAARRAGMTLEEWINATIADRGGRAQGYDRPYPERGYAERAYAEPPVRRRAPVSEDLDAAAAKLAKATRAARPAAGRDLETIISGAAIESERRNRDNTAKTAVALDSVARWIERAEDRISETSRAATERQERTTAVLGEALGLMTRRLEEIERKVVDGHQPSIVAALKAVEKIEHQIARQDEERDQQHAAVQATAQASAQATAEAAQAAAQAAARAAAEAAAQASAQQAAQIEQALKSFQDRLGAIDEKIAQATAPKPMGRRGLDPQDEIRAAITEIRQRQAELEAARQAPPAAPPAPQPEAARPAPPAQAAPSQPASGQSATSQEAAALTRLHAEILLSLKKDVAQLAGRLDAPKAPPPPPAPPPVDPYGPVLVLRDEIDRLQDRIGGLATRGEVGALEGAIRELARHVAEARAPGDIAGVTGPIAELQSQVHRLSDVVAAGVHGRIALDLEALSAKLDGVAESGVDSGIVEVLAHQLGEVRRVVKEIAEPQRVAQLSEQVSDLQRQVAQIGARQVDSIEFASVRQAIDEIRTTLKNPRPADAGAERETRAQFEALSHKLDRLAEQAPRAGAEAAAEQFAYVAERLDELARLQEAQSGAANVAQRIDALAQKLDGLAERQPRADMNLVADQFELVASRLAEITQALPRAGAAAITERMEHLSQKLDRIAENPAPSVTQELKRLASRLDDALMSSSSPAALDHAALEQLEHLSQKIDRLARQPEPSVAEELKRLTSRLEGALATGPAPAVSFDPLIERLDRLDATIRQPRATGELKPIEEMLRGLADRLDQAERPGADSEALDALERQVGEIARRLERDGGTDPTLTALERAMGDLMAQVDSVRSGAADAVERAAATAVAQTLTVLPKAAASSSAPEFGAVKREIADLKAHHSLSDKRTHDTLDAVHSTLEKLVARLSTLEQDTTRQAARAPAPRRAAQAGQAPGPAAAPAPAHTAPASARLEEAVRHLQATARPAGPRLPPSALLDADTPVPPGRTEEILLEPGARRPDPESPARAPDAAPEAQGGAGDIKASFIAAARRAAQAAASEAAAGGRSRGGRTGELPLLSEIAGGRAGVAGRIRETFDRRRRPILMGIAAIILALGTLQLGGMMSGGGDETRVAAPAGGIAQGLETVAGAARPAEPAEPRTTQSVAAQAVAAAEPARDAVAAAPRAEGVKAEGPTPDARPLASPVMTGSLGQGTAPSNPASPMTLPAAAGSAAAPAGVAGPALQASPALPAAASAMPQASAPERIPGMNLVELPAQAGPAGLRQAALAGEPAAVYELAARAADGRGMARDPKLAARLFEKAAAHGLAPAQYRIGNQYEKGIGVPRDLALAKLWYQRAAERGNARAMHNLAVLLAEGAGGKPDYAAAVEWFRKAADHGVRDSQFNLAVLTARGLGVQQDLGQSYAWFAIAAGQGDEDAAKKRDEVAGRLAAADLAAARARADSWKPLTPNPAANDVAVPAQGWSEAPQAASPARKAGPEKGRV